MKPGRATALSTGIFGLLVIAGAPASAADRLVVRVPVCAERPFLLHDRCLARPPRVRPASYVKQYPFGRLREDYTPYGMPGVPARIYFDSLRGRG